MASGIELGIAGLADARIIGRGGFSTVYSARDLDFQRPVAVKVLHNLDEAGQRRFDRERRIMGQLSDHPNVLTPFRSDYTADGNPYLVMELVEGGSLADRLQQRGPIDWETAVDHVIHVARALEHAHKHGVLHRDLKPANVMVGEDGVARLADFGISAIQGSATTQLAYTLSHSPPETFASGHDLRDERSDLYSLASTLYQLIIGRAPFHSNSDSDSQHAMMRRIETLAPPTIPEELAPAALSTLLADALAKDPDHRPQSAREFIEDLNQLRADGTYLARNPFNQPTRTASPPVAPPGAVANQPLVDAAPLRPANANAGRPFWQQGRVVVSMAAMAVVLAVAVVGVATVLPEAPDAADVATGAFEADQADSAEEQATSTSELGATTPSTSVATSPPTSTQAAALDGAAALALTPDGRIAVGEPNGGVWVYDVEGLLAGASPSELPDSFDGVSSLLVLADGRLVVGNGDGVVTVIDDAQPFGEAQFKGHGATGDQVSDLIELADGRVASAGTDADVHVWDPNDPEGGSIRFAGHNTSVNALAQLPDGRIASGGNDGAILVWDPADLETVTVLDQPEGDVRDLVVLADGRLVSVGSAGEVLVVDPAAPDAERVAVAGYDPSFTVLSIVELAGGRVATGDEEGEIRVWSPDEPDRSTVVSTERSGPVVALVALADGSLVSAAADGTVRVVTP